MYGTLSKSAMAPLNDGIVAMDSSAVVPPPTDKPEVVKEEELNDSEGTVVAQGTACKRRGCGHVFNASSSSSTTTCVFHSGAPVFHEGSKGWSCCPRKVLEFDEFLKIKGCKEGKHRFTDVLVSNSSLVSNAYKC